MKTLRFELAIAQPLTSAWLKERQVEASLLRLDRLHPEISGNKWYKLRYYIDEALAQQKKRIVTYGGAWSNHLLATAACCRYYGLDSLGIIRGELPATPSPTLQRLTALGMELQFVSRERYAEKKNPLAVINEDDYLIEEGGFGEPGVRGAATMLDSVSLDRYTHVVCAAGTGTMMAGLILATAGSQPVIGIPVLKAAAGIEANIKKMVGDSHRNWQLLSGFEWGGYARYSAALLDFMNEFYQDQAIPTDIIYTGKLLYACRQLTQEDFFLPGSNLLIVHSGGLQGNRSLPSGALLFDTLL